MASGKHQHIVPRQMIKRFAAEDGKLVELYKANLTIGSRRRGPKGILFKDDFFKDYLSDFDEDLLQKVELKFAKFYPIIADQEKHQELPGEGGSALIDWIAAMLCRTRSLVCLAQVISNQEDKFLSQFLPALINIIRYTWYTECQDVLTRKDFRWKMMIFPQDYCIVLTDNPVCQTNGLNPGGQVTIVPLSKHRVLIGGLQKAIERWGRITSEQLNAFLAGWAEQSIFAADTNTLKVVKKNLEGNGQIRHEDWYKAARKPFFGLPERMMKMQSPSGAELSQWWKEVKDSYGQSIFPQNDGE